jgi:hypothetical protein
MKNENEPINPHLVYTHSGEVQEYSKGLTKREYFAGLAMQGLLASCSNALITENILKQLPILSVQFADSLLSELEITKQQEQ